MAAFLAAGRPKAREVTGQANWWTIGEAFPPKAPPHAQQSSFFSSIGDGLEQAVGRAARIRRSAFGNWSTATVTSSRDPVRGGYLHRGSTAVPSPVVGQILT